MNTSTQNQTADLFEANCVDFIARPELEKRLLESRPLRIKFGMDPSSPDLHLGHMVQLIKLRKLQQLGHQIVLIVGDATAMIGDPSGRNKLRPQLSREAVEANLETYKDQARLVLDMQKTEVRRNSEWFDKMDFQQLIQLSSRMTVARMLERNTFQKRIKQEEPIGIHEFLYPLMQGWDSVMVEADLELGGTDQLFNLLVGRQLQEQEGRRPQICFTLPLILGLDGRKMSKSYDNTVGLTDNPKDMFGKLMSLDDEQMDSWSRLLLGLSEQEHKAMLGGHPRDAKAALAEGITSFLHSDAEAKAARTAFDNQFRDKQIPDDIPELDWPSGEADLPLTVLLNKLGLAVSSSDARRLIEAGAVRIGGEACKLPKQRLAPSDSKLLIQVGKRRFGHVCCQLLTQ